MFDNQVSDQLLVPVNTLSHDVLRSWLFSCPCVIDGRVLVDVRGVHPLAIIGMCVRQIESRDDFVFFVADCLR